MPRRVRPPAVAGLFYRQEPEALREQVGTLMAQVPATQEPAPKALIVPHAGLPYSGPVAATAYARLASVREQVRRVVLLGPSHRVPFEGVAASSAEAFDTPLAEVPLDRAAVDELADLDAVKTLDEAHALEHSLEVQLPFLQFVLDDFALVPLAVGQTEPETVAEVIERLWGGPETLMLISSDLSHFHDYATARRLDEATSRAIEALRPEAIGHRQACGFMPVNGLLVSAARRGLTARTLDLRSSGDTAGPRDQVVGYGAYAIG